MPFSFNPLSSLGLDQSIPLDSAGKIPSGYLPSYVDDVEEYADLASFPATGETGKIYVAIDTGFTYRWSGSSYVRINSLDSITGDVDVAADGTSSIASGVIVNDDVNASAAIADTKLDTISTAGKVSNSATTATDANTANAIVARDASGDFSAGTITADLTGNADTATKLDSSRTFEVTGDVTGTVSSDLTSGASIATSIASGVIVDGDVNAAAAIAGTKIDPDFGSQTVETTGDLAINTDVLFVDSSESAVGIGTTSPSQKLDVNGNISLADGSTIQTASSTHAITIQGGAGAAGGNIRLAGGTGDNDLRFSIGTSEAARIDSSGRLLVGTSSARTNVYYNTSNITPQVLFETQKGDFSGGLALINCSASGFPGVLTLGQSYTNTLGGNGATSINEPIGIINFVANDGTDFRSGATIEAYIDAASGSGDVPTRLRFSVTADGSASPTEAMRINNAGELLVGYTSDNGAYKLQVNSQIFATSATIATSDGRYKENVASLNGCLDLVKALRPVSFTWKPQEDITRLDDEGNEVLVREGHNFPEGTQVGFIAQEVQEVLDGKPWLGSVIKENVRPAVKDNDGNELAPEEQFYGIAEGNLIAVLTNALQEAVTEIESLKARLDAANL